MTTLEILYNVNRKVKAFDPDVNLGGCGFMALTLYNCLSKQTDISNVRIVFQDYQTDDRIEELLKTGSIEVEEFLNSALWDHIFVEFEFSNEVYVADALETWIRADYLRKRLDENIYDYSVSYYDLRRLINRIEWSDIYNKQNTNRLRNIIRREFKCQTEIL